MLSNQNSVLEPRPKSAENVNRKRKATTQGIQITNVLAQHNFEDEPIDIKFAKRDEHKESDYPLNIFKNAVIADGHGNMVNNYAGVEYSNKAKGDYVRESRQSSQS